MASIVSVNVSTGDFSAFYEAFNSSIENMNDDISALSAVGSITFVSGPVNVEGSGTFGGDLSVGGTFIIGTINPDVITANDSANISGTLSVGSSVELSADLGVADSVRISGTLDVEGSARFSATLTLLSALSAVDSVRASGEGVFGSAHVSTELLVAGSIVNSGTLHNENSAFFSNTVEVFGSGNFHEFVSFDSAVTFASAVSFEDGIETETLIVRSGATISGVVSLESALHVLGSANFEDDVSIAGTLLLTGLDAATMSITDSAFVSGEFRVGSHFASEAFFMSGVTFLDSIVISGTIEMVSEAFIRGSLTAVAASFAGSVFVRGTTFISAAMQVACNVTFGSQVTFSAIVSMQDSAYMSGL